MKLFEDGDPFFAPMLNALFAAFRGTAVMDGCEASATGTSRAVSITAGSVQIDGVEVAVGAGSVTLDAGGSFDRYDLISVDASGSKIVTKGATKRKCPPQPANTCLLAIVFVPAGATVIATGDVYDARMDALRLSQIVIDADKNWGGRNITNLGKISPKTWLALIGTDPLLISKSHASSTTVTFAQLDGAGHVKVVVAGAGVNLSGTRVFTILKNGSQIWTMSQESQWGGDGPWFPAFTKTAFEDLSIASGDTLTLSRTGGSGAVTLKIYSTPLVAPYGIVS